MYDDSATFFDRSSDQRHSSSAGALLHPAEGRHDVHHWLIALAFTAATQTTPAQQRFDYLVRADFFAGAAGDQTRLAKVVELCERTLADNPGHAEAMVWHGASLLVLDVARISHFSSKDKLTFAVVNGREHVIDHTLTELESRLDPRRFVRIHRATILNIAFVQELYPGVDALRNGQGALSLSKGGGVLVRLKDEGKTELSVARDRVRQLKDRLGI